MENLSLEHAWAFCQEKINGSRDLLRQFLSKLNQGQASSSQGLLQMLEMEDKLPDLDRSLLWVQDFMKGYSRLNEVLEREWLFLADDFLDDLPREGIWLELREDRRHLLAEMQQWQEQKDPWSSLDHWLSRAQEWKIQYLPSYMQAHDLHYRSGASRDELWFQAKVREIGVVLPKDTEYKDCIRDLDLELTAKPFCRCGFRPKLGMQEHPDHMDYLPLFEFLIRGGYPEHSIQQLKTALSNSDWVGALQTLVSMEKQVKERKVRPLSLKSICNRWQGRYLTRDQMLKELEALLGDDPNQMFELKE